MQNTEYLHDNVASTFKDTLNFHSVRAYSEAIETHNAPKVKSMMWEYNGMEIRTLCSGRLYIPVAIRS